MAKSQLSDIFAGDYPISQYYGNNKPYYKKFGLLLGHEGVDWATPSGVKLLTPFNTAIVLRSAYDPTYGYYVTLWDSVQKCAVWYCHLSKLLITPGQRLNRFSVVGLTGRSGNVTGPHVHVNFVETDGYANRLNMKNGNQGFLNILDPKLTSWQLSK